MNYKELLESKAATESKRERVPFGRFCKQKADSKYINIVELRHELADSLLFCEDLASECKKNEELKHQGQMHFFMDTDASAHIIRLNQGSFLTFERLLDENHAVVAESNFIQNTMKSLIELTEYLHSNGIYHVCYAPSNVFARKSDNQPMLLFHGSAYENIKDTELLYPGCDDYLAPEILNGEAADGRTDVYGLGRFMQFLYREMPVPVELKSVIAKATNADPDKRYASPNLMWKAIVARQGIKRSLLSLVAAVVIALLCMGFYFSMVPEQDDIEFVAPAASQQSEDLLDDGFDPVKAMEALDGAEVDEEGAVTVDDKKMKEYEAKAEQIFRKQYTAAANRILSKVYNNSRMGDNEKQFMVESEGMMQELVKAQMELAEKSGIGDMKSQRIASEIIEMITNQKKKEMAAKAQQEGIEPIIPKTQMQRQSATDPSDAHSALPHSSTSTSTDNKTHSEKVRQFREKEQKQEREDMLNP